MWIRWAFLAILPAGAVSAQPHGKIDLSKMRPTGLLVDAYSYTSPPHNEYYFHHIDQLGFRIDRVRRSGPTVPFATGPVLALPDLEGYFTRNHVTGFLVLRWDTVLIEWYFHGADRRSWFVSQSVGKSIASILVGVAVEEDKIRSIGDPVTQYLPELAPSGYRNVTIKNVLQMATGVDYSEDYRDSTSGAAQIGAMLITGTPSFSAFVGSMKPTAVPLARWAETRLWSKLGAESSGYSCQAKRQPETCAFTCFNATLRDDGRIGLLMLGRGAIGGRRVVSESWVAQSTTPDADYLKPRAAEPGLRGLNFALGDISLLAAAMVEWYRTGSSRGLDQYSERRLARVWRAEDFSFQMTTLLHRFPEDHAGFNAQLQLARLHTLTRSRAASTALAEGYVGL